MNEVEKNISRKKKIMYSERFSVILTFILEKDLP